MKTITLISYQYSKAGYREDDWQIIRTISNEKELFEALKEGYLQDARNRNNYPMVSFSIGRIFTYDNLFQYEDYSWLGGDYNYEDSEDYNEFTKDLRDYSCNDDLEIKNNFKNTLNKFNKWEKRVKSLIPIIRNKSNIIKKEQQELDLLFKLANKFNYTLTIKEKQC